MGEHRHSRYGRRAWAAAAGAIVTGVLPLVLLVQLPDGVFAVNEVAPPAVGSATGVDALGSPYGGCGVPQHELDSQNFVALNVYNTPGDYSSYPRPLPPELAGKIGMWNNGLNCGRWVQVKIGDYCAGVNDGARNQGFCRKGSWIRDGYNDGVLNMIVADSCGDANAWCRDDPYHVDLAKGALNSFVKDGTILSDLYPDHWNNRKVTWKFVQAPNYRGDIKIGFLRGAQVWWPAIAVSHLANGIHGVEYFADGVWRNAAMIGDMGQSYVIGGTTVGGSPFQIRVRDADGVLINDGRIYRFSLPASCESSCAWDYTRVSYTTSDPEAATPPTVDTTAPVAPEATPTTTEPVAPAAVPTTATPVPPATTSPPTASGASCRATSDQVNSWFGPPRVRVTVTAGASPISSWTVTWRAEDGTSGSGPYGTGPFGGAPYGSGWGSGQVWGGIPTVNGTTVTVKNTAYNGSLAANAATSFSFLANAGVPAIGSALTCAAS